VTVDAGFYVGGSFVAAAQRGRPGHAGLALTGGYPMTTKATGGVLEDKRGIKLRLRVPSS